MTKITKSKYDAIVDFMNGEIREQVHAELAPCTDTEFLKRYLELDEGFVDVLHSEFGIPLYDDIEVSSFDKIVYNTQYNLNHYARVELKIPKAKKAEWGEQASLDGMSLTSWIVEMVERGRAHTRG